MQKQNILIVEDEILSATFIKRVLQKLGHIVVAIVDNATEALSIVKKHKIDFVFMDINLEKMVNGILCAKLLNREKNIPIIYVTAFRDSKTIEEASKTNSYGYLIKPFNEDDIKASLATAISMHSRLNLTEQKVDIINFKDNYSFNLNTQTLTLNNKHIHLTNKETRLLMVFSLNINQNISYDMLIEYVWDNKNVSTSTIRDTISRLRKKIPPLEFENIAGVGYCLINS